MNKSPGDLIAKVNRNIEQYGFEVIHVFPDENDEHGQFSYTVGFWESYDHPEVMVSGLLAEISHAFFWILQERIARGESFFPGFRYDEICSNYPVEFREIPPPRKPLNWATNYYGGEDFPALQMVFPDKKGIFPGEEGYNMSGVQELATGQWD